MKKATEVEVLNQGKSANNALLKGGGDAVAAKQLTKLFTEAQTGMRRIVALGLFAWELKETKLKHGEFGPWLAQHCPKLATANEFGKARPSRALQGYMDLTRGVLESVGFATVEKYLEAAAGFSASATGGKFLLMPDKKVPDEVKPLRDKIFELVDGKTQRALFMEFKQAEDDEEGNAKPKRGRMKGQGGATKEQRAKAQELEEQEQVTALNLWCEETAEKLMEICDDQGLGRPGVKDSPEYRKLEEAVAYYHGWIRHGGEA